MATPYANVYDNDKTFTCVQCRHFAPLYENEIPSVIAGECRALPPAACCSAVKYSAPPVFPILGLGAAAQKTWCSSWQQKERGA